MALRSLAVKLGGLLQRADLPAVDMKELARYRTPLGREVAKTIIEESRLFHEEAQKSTRRGYRNAGLFATAVVGFTAFAVSSILDDLEELDKLNAEAKGKAAGAQR